PLVDRGRGLCAGGGQAVEGGGAGDGQVARSRRRIPLLHLLVALLEALESLPDEARERLGRAVLTPSLSWREAVATCGVVAVDEAAVEIDRRCHFLAQLDRIA